MKFWRWLLMITVLAALLPACHGPQVQATSSDPVLRYNFEKEAPGWSIHEFLTIGANRVLGPFNNRNRHYKDGTHFTVTGWPAGKDLLISFDLYCIGTLDSGGDLADRIWVELGDGTLLLDVREFPKQTLNKKGEVIPGDSGWIQIGERKRAFWTIPEQIRIPAGKIVDGSVTLIFDGELTGRKTEFWALDNVVVEVPH